MILKYVATLLITWVAYNVIATTLFNLNDLVFICCCFFIYAFNIINIDRHHPFAISAIAIALMMVMDGSCIYNGSYAAVGRYYQCIEYDTVRVLAAYSWALGGLISITIIGLWRLGRRNVAPRAVHLDNVVVRLNINAARDYAIN